MPQLEEAEALPNGISEEMTEGRSQVAAQRTGDDESKKGMVQIG